MPARVVVFSTFFDVSAIGRTLVGLPNRMAAAPADKFPAGARAPALAIRHSEADVLRRISRELAGPPAVAGGVGAAAAGPEPRAEPGRAGRHPARHRAGGRPHAAAVSPCVSLGDGEPLARPCAWLGPPIYLLVVCSLYQVRFPSTRSRTYQVFVNWLG